jgi:hypothetical protein
MEFSKIINKISPKKLFLIDSLGALLTAILLGIVLANFETVFGMPCKVLYGLSFMACLFSIYSFLCFLSIMVNWRFYMKVIACANLLYCCLTAVLVVFFYPSLSIFGVSYFLGELVVISILIYLEYKVIRQGI